MKRRIFQVNKVGRRIIFDRLILLFLFVLFLIMGRAVWRFWEKNSLAESNLVSSEIHLKQLEERKKMLESKLKKLETARGVEEEIRTNYLVTKPGEKVINIVETEKATITSTTTSKRHWWQIF